MALRHPPTLVNDNIVLANATGTLPGPPVLGGLINECAPPHDGRETSGRQPDRIFERHKVDPLIPRCLPGHIALRVGLHPQGLRAAMTITSLHADSGENAVMPRCQPAVLDRYHLPAIADGRDNHLLDEIRDPA